MSRVPDVVAVAGADPRPGRLLRLRPAATLHARLQPVTVQPGLGSIMLGHQGGLQGAHL